MSRAWCRLCVEPEMKRFWWRSTFRVRRLSVLSAHGKSRSRRGATGFLTADDTDRFIDFTLLPGGVRAMAHRGEEWVWDVEHGCVEGLVHARRWCDDGSVLPDDRHAEGANASVSSGDELKDRKRNRRHGAPA